MGQNAPYLCIVKRVTGHGVYSNISVTERRKNDIGNGFYMDDHVLWYKIVTVQTGLRIYCADRMKK